MRHSPFLLPRSKPLLAAFVSGATVLSLLCLGACSTTATKTLGQSTQVEGRASYYGGEHVGRTTSSGAILNPSRMTAAHRTLPFGTQVMVTNLENSHSCNVKITDRGPAISTGRVIDVSEAAARCLDMVRSGVVPVRVQYTE